MISDLRKSRNYARGAKVLGQSELSLDQLLRPIYIAQDGGKIDFTRGVSLESETEAERHSGSSGDG